MATVDEFFDLVEDSFSRQEWAFVHGAGSHLADHPALGSLSDPRMLRFTTLWTLKEAYVKAIGIGIGLKMQEIHFLPKQGEDSVADRVPPGSCPLHALPLVPPGELRRVSMDVFHGSESLNESWTFYAGRVDDSHPVAVAVGPWGVQVSSLGDSDSHDRRGLGEPERSHAPFVEHLPVLAFQDWLRRVNNWR